MAYSTCGIYTRAEKTPTEGLSSDGVLASPHVLNQEERGPRAPQRGWEGTSTERGGGCLVCSEEGAGMASGQQAATNTAPPPQRWGGPAASQVGKCALRAGVVGRKGRKLAPCLGVQGARLRGGFWQ